jgi:hypothetical protein
MRTILAVLLFLTIGCSGKSLESDLEFKGDLAGSDVQLIEAYIRKLGSEMKFNIFEKDKRELSTITQGKPAFFIAFYLEGQKQPVMTITNAGVGSTLFMDFMSNKKFQADDIKALSERIVYDLDVRFGVEMSLSEFSAD